METLCYTARVLEGIPYIINKQTELSICDLSLVGRELDERRCSPDNLLLIQAIRTSPEDDSYEQRRGFSYLLKVWLSLINSSTYTLASDCTIFALFTTTRKNPRNLIWDLEQVITLAQSSAIKPDDIPNPRRSTSSRDLFHRERQKYWKNS